MGELAEFFLRAGYRNYVAVEPNTLMRDQVSKKGIIAKDYLIPRLLEEDNSYDVILLSDVFEHLNDTNEAKLFISEAKRVLKPGGLICIGTPDYTHWREDFFNADFSHSNITSVRRTVQMFQNNNIKIVKNVYMSGFLIGMPATILSNLVRIGFSFLHSDRTDNKIYKLKLTFLRRFLIIGMA